MHIDYLPNTNKQSKVAKINIDELFCSNKTMYKNHFVLKNVWLYAICFFIFQYGLTQTKQQ